MPTIFNSVQRIWSRFDKWDGRNIHGRKVPQHNTFFTSQGAGSPIFDLTKRHFLGVTREPRKDSTEPGIFKEIEYDLINSPFVRDPSDSGYLSYFTWMPCSREPKDNSLIDPTRGVPAPRYIFPNYTNKHYHWLEKRNFNYTDKTRDQWFEKFKGHGIRDHKKKKRGYDFENTGFLSSSLTAFETTFVAFVKTVLLPNYPYHSITWGRKAIRLLYYIKHPVIDEFLEKIKMKPSTIPHPERKPVTAYAIIFEIPYTQYDQLSYYEQACVLTDFQEGFPKEKREGGGALMKLLESFSVAEDSDALTSPSLFKTLKCSIGTNAIPANCQELIITPTIVEQICKDLAVKCLGDSTVPFSHINQALTPSQWKEQNGLYLSKSYSEKEVSNFMNSYCLANTMTEPILDLVTVFPLDSYSNSQWHSRCVSQEIVHNENKPKRVPDPRYTLNRPWRRNT